MTLKQHVVVASDDRWIMGTRFEYRPRIWRVNDGTVATGAGQMELVESWATQHLPRRLVERPILEALGDVPLHRLLTEDRPLDEGDTTLMLAGVGQDAGPAASCIDIRRCIL